MIRRYLPKSTEELIHWYERYIAPVALVGGFLLDTFFFLERVDVISGNLLLLSYLLLAGAGILLLNAIESGKFTHALVLKVAPFVPVAVQFAFGGLLSGYLSLYGRSAGPLASWIFVIVIALLLVGNERFRARYTQFPFQVSMLFIALLSFLIFFIPVVIKMIGPWVFVLSVALGAAVVTLFVLAASKVAPVTWGNSRRVVLISLTAIFAAFNALYFLDLIPPLPLALKHAGVYHSVKWTGESYELRGEKRPWIERYLPVAGVFHRSSQDPVYVFTTVFAPTGLRTTIIHEWQRYGASDGAWVTESVIPFAIVGGRDGGFRGYTQKSGLENGFWRVNVQTAYRQTLGRVEFQVRNADTPLELEVTLE